jgi:MFS family permease
MRDTAEGQQKHGQQEHIETLPLFSTTDKNGRMTMLPPGRRVGRSAPLMPWLLTAAVLWALTGSVPFGALLGMAPTPAISMVLGHPVTVGIAVLLLFVAISMTATSYSRSIEQFGQTRVAGLFATLSVTGGLAAVAGILLFWTLTSDLSRPFDLEAIATSQTIPLELGAVVGASFALWAAIALLRLPGSIAHARRRQVDIERLRKEGLSCIGTLTALHFTNSWLFNLPIFTVEVHYIVDGAPRVVSAYMRTSADRVPVVGSILVVLTDDRGTTHVELDQESGATFEPDVGKYAPSDG